MRVLLVFLSILWLASAVMECQTRSALQDATGIEYELAMAAYDHSPVPTTEQVTRFNEAKRMMVMSNLVGVSLFPAGAAILVGTIIAFQRKSS